MGTVWDRTTAFLGDRSAAVLAIAGPLIFLPTCLQEILRPAMSDAGTGGGAAFGLVAIVLAVVMAWGQLSVVALVVVSGAGAAAAMRSEAHTSELPSLMRISYAVFCLTKKNTSTQRISYD